MSANLMSPLFLVEILQQLKKKDISYIFVKFVSLGKDVITQEELKDEKLIGKDLANSKDAVEQRK